MDYVIFFSKYLFVFVITSFLLANLFLIKWGKKVSFFNYEIIFVMHSLAFIIISRDIGILKSLGLGFLSLIFFVLVSRFLKRTMPDIGIVIFNCVVFLLDIGLIMLSRIDFYLAAKQFLWIILSVGLLLLLPIFFDFTLKFKWLSIFYMIGGIFLLGMNFVYGGQINGAMNWLNLFGMKFQPSEIVKFIYIFYLAYALEKRSFILPTIFSGIIILFLVLQKDLGGALIFFILYASQIYFVSGRKQIFIAAFFLILIGFIIGYFIFPHVKVRIISWLNPWDNIRDEGYQIAQSLFAIGSGNLFGSGLTIGFVKYIPVAQSDFIFSAICEEFGNIFACGIIFIFILLAFSITKIIILCKDLFCSIILNGTMSLICFQTFLILGGCVKLIPLTGIVLPFVSYGGTSLVVNTLLLACSVFILMKRYKQIYSAELFDGEDNEK